MNITQTVDTVRPNVSRWSITVTVVVLAAVAVSEALLFFGHLRYALWSHSLLLVGLSLAPLWRAAETPVFQAVALLPAFRLVNLTMPVFVELSLFWFPLVYAPFVPAVLYLVWNERTDETADRGLGHELPWWLGGSRSGKVRRAVRCGWRSLAPPEGESRLRVAAHRAARLVFVLSLPVVAVASLVGLGFGVVYLAEFEYDLIRPAPVVPSLASNELLWLAVVMVVFVGFVEELLFRGVLQKVLERRLGLLPGLVLASGVFGAMHSGYGVGAEVGFAFGVGLLLGSLYDLTDSLLLVSVVHGALNVLVFGVIPLDGGSSVDLLRTNTIRLLQQYDFWWLVRPMLDLWPATGIA